MRILIVGTGWIGSRLAVLLREGGHDVDVISGYLMREARSDYQIVVNAIGRCGVPNVDWCGSTPKSRASTIAGNVEFIPKLIDQFCRVPKIVHISSGCLWQTGIGITEDALPEPPSFYSLTKAAGELLMQGHSGAVIARVRMPFDSVPHERNLFGKVAAFDMVMDGANSVTSIRLLAHFIMADPSPGTWNVVHRGAIRNTSLRGMMADMGLASPVFDVVSHRELKDRGLIRENRSTCTLSTEKLRGLMDVPMVEDAIMDALREYATYAGNK